MPPYPTHLISNYRKGQPPWFDTSHASVVALTLLAAIPTAAFATSDNWSNAVSGNWSDPNNWSAGVPNTTTTDALINASEAPYTVALNTNIALNSLTLGNAQTTLDQSTGNLTIASTLDLQDSTYKIAGTLMGPSSRPTVQSSGTGKLLVYPGSAPASFFELSLATDATILGGANLTIFGVTFSNSTIHLAGSAANPATLDFIPVAGGSNYNGTATFLFDGSDNANTVTGISNLPTTLTIKSGTTGGTLSTSATLVGIISSETANATISLSRPLSIAKSGLLQAINGGNIVVTGNVGDGGTINVGAGSSITLTGQLTETTPASAGAITGTGAIYANSISGGVFNIPNTVHITGTGLNNLTGLSIGGSTDNWTGTLEIGHADLRIRPINGSANITTLQNQLQNGAIISSNLTPTTGIALMTAADYTAATGNTTLDGNSLVSTDILLHLAPLGDTNLDGKIDLSDLSTILNNFGTTTSSWTAGNFDYAPTIDLTDLSDVLNNFGLGTAPAPSSEAPVPSPEPASLLAALSLIPAISLRRTRRQTH